MGEAVPNPPPGFDDLTVDEQIEYVQALWERISATPEQVPVPEWHSRVLKEREDVGGGRPWPDVREDLARKLDEGSSG